MIDKGEYEILHTILKMREAGPTEASIIQGFINRHMDPECYICGHCGAQIRLGFERVKTWYEIHKLEIETVEIDNIDNSVIKKPGRPKTK